MCPRIDLEIDSNLNVYVSREFFKTKSETDTKFIGDFQGNLDQNDSNKLLGLLEAVNLDTLKFPDVTCCDAPVITIIVYFNGERRYFKSMLPPAEVNELIAFLKGVGTDKKIGLTCRYKTLEE